MPASLEKQPCPFPDFKGTADSVERRLFEMNSLEREKPSIMIRRTPEWSDSGLSGRVFVDWDGPVEPLLKMIAREVNGSFQVLGKPSPLPVLVDVHAEGVPITDFLEDISVQLKQRAELVVVKDNRTIELHYLGM